MQSVVSIQILITYFISFKKILVMSVFFLFSQWFFCLESILIQGNVLSMSVTWLRQRILKSRFCGLWCCCNLSTILQVVLVNINMGKLIFPIEQRTIGQHIMRPLATYTVMYSNTSSVLLFVFSVYKTESFYVALFFLYAEKVIFFYTEKLFSSILF